MARTVSVVVNTYNRAASLDQLLKALRVVDYEDFEVVVVNGPSTDNTEDVLASYASDIKVERCGERNLSMSRNVGIAASAGEVVAFIDDDAYPDPAWLSDLAAAYDDDETAAAGGPTFDASGFEFQATYNVANRIADAWWDWSWNPTAALNHPDGDLFPYVVGTNSSFRRSVITSLGGFDENYEYYLDETDVCRRVVSAGWKVSALDKAFVYHKFLPSSVRDHHRVLRDRFPLLKNRLYFGYRHGGSQYDAADVDREFVRFADYQRADCRFDIDRGLLSDADLRQLEADIERAISVARSAAADAPRTRPPEWFAQPSAFHPFPRTVPSTRKLHLAIVTGEYPPAPVNGIARYLHSLAVGIAAHGHVVRVLTSTLNDFATVDLEDGVWVHRIPARSTIEPPPALAQCLPRIWHPSAAFATELHRVAKMRSLDLVHVANWDSEGVAILADGTWPVVMSIVTPLATSAQINPELFHPGSEEFRRLIETERWCYEHADAFLAPSPSVPGEIEAGYGVALPVERTEVVPLGLPAASTRAEPPTGRKVLFVGRLERRKGIDTLLDAFISVVRAVPDVELLIAGDDTIPSGADGRPFRAAWEADSSTEGARDRVRFLGRVSDDELDQLYRECDVLVAPSRYESFGLILLEAMRQGRPVVAGNCGGMKTIVVEGVTGHLVEPGDHDALAAALTRLLNDPAGRIRMGEAGRQRFDERFTTDVMVAATLEAYERVAENASGPGTRPGPESSMCRSDD